MQSVISRVWRGWTTRADADAYEAFLRDELFPLVRRIAGFRGAQVLRRDAGADEVEFVTVTRFDSLDAVRAFAGEEYENPVIEPSARHLLSRFEDRVEHYETIEVPAEQDTEAMSAERPVD